MPISIFTPEAEASATGSSDDVVGRFRAGYQVNGRPMGLDKFRLTTGDPEVADKALALLGDDDGSGVSEWETKTEENLQIFTEADLVPIILDSKGAVRSSLVLWGRKGMLYETDGTFLIKDGELTDEEAPCAGWDIKRLKSEASNGMGPDPSIRVFFRLAADPELGRLKFFSSSWTALDEFAEAEALVEDLGFPCSADLWLERVEFTTKEGEDRSFVKPRITNIVKMEA